MSCETNTSEKYYKVVKDTYLWKAGAIIALNGESYKPITDMWNVIDGHDGSLSAKVVHASPEWFTRVYKLNKLSQIVYAVKEEAAKFFGDQHAA